MVIDTVVNDVIVGANMVDRVARIRAAGSGDFKADETIMVNVGAQIDGIVSTPNLGHINTG